MFVEVKLKSGQKYFGYIIEESGSLLHFLNLENDHLKHISISKSAIEGINDIRPYTDEEVQALHNFKIHSKTMGDVTHKIRTLSNQLELLKVNREKELETLLKTAKSVERTHSEEVMISYNDLLPLLKQEGFKNIFILQHKGIMSFEGEKEELVFTFGEKYTFLLRHLKDIANLFNLKDFSKENANSYFPAFVYRNTEDKRKNISEEAFQTKQATTSSTNTVIKLSDIQDKLIEPGFKKLKELKESGIVTVKDDGTIDFGELTNLPFISPLLKNPDFIVNFLNQPSPLDMIPMKMDFGNDLTSIFKEIQKNMRG